MSMESARRPASLSARVDSSDGRWSVRRWSTRVPLVRGRLVGTVLVLVAALCAAPATIWPSHTLTYTPPPGDGATGAVGQQIAFWSWGRIADADPATTDSSLDLGNPWGLLLLVAALVVGVAAAVCHGFRRGTDGLLLGVAGASWLAAHLAADLGQTAGRLGGDFYGAGEGIDKGTTVVGVLQFVAVGLLLVAIGTMAWRPVLALVVAAWSRGSALVRRLRDRAKRDEAEGETGTPTPPRVGIATIRDLEPGAGHGSFSGVGFSDDAGSEQDRFRPPR